MGLILEQQAVKDSRRMHAYLSADVEQADLKIDRVRAHLLRPARPDEGRQRRVHQVLGASFVPPKHRTARRNVRPFMPKGANAPLALRLCFTSTTSCLI